MDDNLELLGACPEREREIRKGPFILDAEASLSRVW